MDIGMYNSYLEVDFGRMKESFRKVQAAAGRRGVIPVLKANAYGIGLVPMADFLVNTMNCDVMAVAQTSEGVLLRQAGFRQVDIMLLGPAPRHALPYAVENNLLLPVFSRETALWADEAAAALGKTARVQLKIDTGMNRIGVRQGAALEDLLAFLKTLEHLRVEGVFTHFVNATYTDDPQTPVAYAKFEQAVAQLRAAGFAPKYIHCCNTGATSWFKDDRISTHVRPGSLYMGYDSMDDGTNWLGVEECVSWRAFITNIHTVPAGESCGYCNHYVCRRDTMVATVDIGYADGLFRPLAQGGTGGVLLVNDTRCRYLATSMDQTMVDVTGVPCRVGDQVTVFGYSQGGAKLPLAELMRYTGQNLSYPLCLTNHRVKRIYRY
ncbi:MAG: alanine racemase [Clostridia bacterium]|nr:alanine racemase [Clostridia bacterium]